MRASLIEDPRLLRKLATALESFPLSAREWLSGYARYQAALRKFAQEHPDTILIDAAEDPLFAAAPDEELLSYFLDMNHPTSEGNRRLAIIIAASLRKQGLLK